MRAIVEVQRKARKGVSPNYDGLYYLLTRTCDRRARMKFATVVPFDGLVSAMERRRKMVYGPRQVEGGDSACCISVNIKISRCSESRLSPCDKSVEPFSCGLSQARAARIYWIKVVHSLFKFSLTQRGPQTECNVSVLRVRWGDSDTLSPYIPTYIVRSSEEKGLKMKKVVLSSGHRG
jgi:hypothetical protein